MTLIAGKDPSPESSYLAERPRETWRICANALQPTSYSSYLDDYPLSSYCLVNHERA